MRVNMRQNTSDKSGEVCPFTGPSFFYQFMLNLFSSVCPYLCRLLSSRWL